MHSKSKICSLHYPIKLWDCELSSTRAYVSVFMFIGIYICKVQILTTKPIINANQILWCSNRRLTAKSMHPYLKSAWPVSLHNMHLTSVPKANWSFETFACDISSHITVLHMESAFVWSGSYEEGYFHLHKDLMMEDNTDSGFCINKNSNYYAGRNVVFIKNPT